jgi:putative protease
MVEQMSALRLKRQVAQVQRIEIKKTANLAPTDSAKLNIILRNKKQVEALATAIEANELSRLGIGPVTLDFEFGKDFAPSVKLLKEAGLRVGIATTRILKPKEYYNFKIIQVAGPDFVLARNLGAIQYFTNETSLPVKADFSLNITNSWAAEYLLSKGVESLNASYDLNQNQLMSLAAHMDASKLEVTLHQYMPEFHMEHCVFAAFMSNGSSFKDCGKPCERHEVKLKDPYGNWHHLKPDQECRNTFYRATPQSASFLVDELKNIGVKEYRLEALNESEQVLIHKIKTYLKLLQGELSSEQVVKEIGVVESYGLSSGQLSNTKAYKDRKKEVSLS